MSTQKDNSKFCLVCRPRNPTLYWHKNPEDHPKDPGGLWVWCNKCDRGYSLEYYCHSAGISVIDFLKNDFDFQEAKPNEVTAMNWPTNFIPLSDPRAKAGVEYVKSRGLSLDGDLYYDLADEGIVFPMYLDNHFCGAQIRFIEERIKEDGAKWKITTIPGTRLGLLFYGWNSGKFLQDYKAIVVTEGAFNCLSIRQALNIAYGGISNNPWFVVACSGSGISLHQQETLKELKEQGRKVVCAFDSDDAGFKGLCKLKDTESITHYALTGDTEKDWNNLLQDLGPEGLAQFFIKSVKSI